MRSLTFSFLAIPLLLLGCTMPGDLAKGVDPVEGRLVQKLIEESCGKFVIRRQDRTIMQRNTVTADDIAILQIEDTQDDGRIAWFRVFASEFRFAYHPQMALVECDSYAWVGLHPPRYTHASPILVERGGDPSLYEKVRKSAERKQQRAQQQAALLDATFPIRVQWGGMAETLTGSLREIRSGSEGTLAVELPKTLGTCTGSYRYTGDNVGTWNVTCPNDLMASGTFQSGNGAHGEGVDSLGRAITYTIEMGS
ncbi:MAG: hypothetical protein JKY27_03880 [Magnetovibrio sp.]|nr:hypothetical protein [Magnetovibrio sp.]